MAFWKARTVARQHEYRARVSVPRPAGTMALPGDAAALRFYEDPQSAACMVHDPHRQTLSVDRRRYPPGLRACSRPATSRAG